MLLLSWHFLVFNTLVDSKEPIGVYLAGQSLELTGAKIGVFSII